MLREKGMTAVVAALVLLVGGAALAQGQPALPVAGDALANPYGLLALWQQGGWIARGTLLALVCMSVLSWYLGVAKWLEQARLLRQAAAAQALVGAGGAWLSGVAGLAEDSPFRYLAEEGGAAAAEYQMRKPETISLDDWLGISSQQAVAMVAGRLQCNLAVLATTGSTAPFVGLFGTVWGIYHALTAIGVAGQASLDKVAGPVGEALIMTALGLVVAVPAVLAYNALVRRNKVAMDQVRRFAGDVHKALLIR